MGSPPERRRCRRRNPSATTVEGVFREGGLSQRDSVGGVRRRRLGGSSTACSLRGWPQLVPGACCGACSDDGWAHLLA